MDEQHPPQTPQDAGERRYVSSAQLARALGVGDTTVKRWCKEGRLPHLRTPGGHRRILCADALEYIRRENLPFVDLGELGVAEPTSPVPEPAALVGPYFDALLAGDPERARSILLGAHQSGLTAARIGDELVMPVMARVGHGWATEALDVYQEHRATQTCLSALLALKARIDSNGPVPEDRPLAVGGGPEFDHYILANVLVELSLKELGWRVVNVGPNTPFSSFRRATKDLRPRLVWLSCSYLADAAAFAREYRAFYEEAVVSGVAVSVGGRALTESVREEMTFTHHGDRLAHLLAFARELQSRK